MQQEPRYRGREGDTITEFTINKVYPWGRSFDEYCHMFRLTTGDLEQRILGCADGPASFNAAMNRRGLQVVSCDPLYRFDAMQIRERIEATYPEMLRRATHDRHRFVWNVIRSPEMLSEIRMAAMNEFLLDYDDGRRSGRYLAEALPQLSFADDKFDLALCSHFLFLYSDEVSGEEHVRAVQELCRVASEVRIFPLLDMTGNRSPHVQRVFEELEKHGLQVRVEQVAYEFQGGGNEMMRITRSAA
jgi:hypothetical protein